MKRNQQGLSTVEGLLILVIVVIVSFTGWYVYHSRHAANKSYSNSATSTNQTPAVAKSSGTQDQSSAQKASGGCILNLTIGQREGTAGTFHEDLIFTNMDKANCTLNGFPSVTLLDSGGYQIGQAAAHDTSVSATTVTVKPHESAYAGLSLPDPGIAANCSSTPSSLIQAVVPGQSTVTLKATDASDYYCPNFMVRPFQTTPSI